MNSTVIEIPQELLAPAAFARYEGTFTLEVLKAGPDLYSFREPVSWGVDITNTGDALLLQGEAEVCGTTYCARCLEPVEVDLFGELEGYYLLDPDDVPEDMEGDEFEVLPEDRKIDVAPLITAALLLDVPMIPLCSEDCKGICPTCGANLNEGECGCADEAGEAAAASPDNPFAALAGLKLD
ncbi:MAG: DUF177 domain-containing protein [Eggerthellaceae bacterium]|nr:DUF177 domain-containing protein [Eggerthellaceae bacterium]